MERYETILDELPAGVVFETPEGLLLADGYHRVKAAQLSGRTAVQADIRQGSMEDALRFAVDLAVAEHGLTRSEAIERIRYLSEGRWGGSEGGANP